MSYYVYTEWHWGNRFSKDVSTCTTSLTQSPNSECVVPWASAHRGKWGQLTTPWKNGRKIKKRKDAKKQFSTAVCLCYTSRAIRVGSCRERRYADHIFIQINFRMHHFVVKFSKLSSPQAARGH